MAFQDENNRSTQTDEERRNQGSSQRNERTGQRSTSREPRLYPASGDAPQQYGNLSEETQPFSEPANEWQRVGHFSDQNWWQSGTQQQQEAYRGDIGYPYRENYGERNQEAQRGVENLYPQEPASERQRQNFAEGTQYPYEKGYEAENPQARQGLERAKEWPGMGREESFGRRQGQEFQSSREYGDQTGKKNQRTNQNQNTMRPDERNLRRDYNEYTDREYRGDWNRMEDRENRYDRDRREQRYDRPYDRRDFYADREPDTNRGYSQDRGYGRGPNYERRGDYGQERSRTQYRGHNQGQYHSTETDVPGRGYDTEREMNRHAHNYSGYADRDREYDQRNRNPRRVLNNSVSSSHRATGPYEDFERDLDRYGVRGGYQERYGSYDRPDRDREQGPSRNRGLYYRPQEDVEGRSRLSGRMRDRGLERSPSGNWGPSENEYNNRYREDRGRY